MQLTFKTAYLLAITLSLVAIQHANAQYGGYSHQGLGASRNVNSLSDVSANFQPGDKWLKALSEPVKVEFVDTPMMEVADYISELHGIPVHLDITELEDLGISGDEPITIVISAVSLEQALKLMLEPLGLDFYCAGDILTITTKEDAEEMMYVTVRDVSKLITMGGYQQEGLIDLLQGHIPGAEWHNADGVGGAIRVDENVLVLTHNFHTHRQAEKLLNQIEEQLSEQENDATLSVVAYRLDSAYTSSNGKAQAKTPDGEDATPAADDQISESKLASVIQDLIAPGTWKQDAGEIKTLPGVLAIKQTTSTHREIKKFLEPMLLKPEVPNSQSGGQPADGLQGYLNGGIFGER